MMMHVSIFLLFNIGLAIPLQTDVIPHLIAQRLAKIIHLLEINAVFRLIHNRVERFNALSNGSLQTLHSGVRVLIDST